MNWSQNWRSCLMKKQDRKNKGSWDLYKTEQSNQLWKVHFKFLSKQWIIFYYILSTFILVPCYIHCELADRIQGWVQYTFWNMYIAELLRDLFNTTGLVSGEMKKKQTLEPLLSSFVTSCTYKTFLSLCALICGT